MTTETKSEPGLRRALGPFDATMVLVGGLIGAGIFINPYIVAQRLDSPFWVLAAWVLGGLVAMAGAFTFADKMDRIDYGFIIAEVHWKTDIGFL